MSRLYLDSSALAKLYLPEDAAGRQTVLQALDQHDTVVSSAIAYAEVCSALARYLHEGRIEEAEYERDLDIFREDWMTADVINVTPEVSELAGQLLRAQPGLRAMDALHLASALWLRRREAIRFLSFDHHLNTVARNLMPGAFY